MTSTTSVFYLPGWLNRLEVTAGARLREAWRRSPALDPGSPGLARPTVRSPQLLPLHPQPRLYFLPAFLAPGFPKACGQTPPPTAPGSVWGAASPTWPPLGGDLGDRDPPSAAGRGVPGRWAATTRPLGAHLSRETVRRCQARATGSSSVRGRRRPVGARHAVGFSGSLSVRGPVCLPLCPSSRASLESPLPRPPPPQPASLGPAVGRLRCHSALPGRSHAARRGRRSRVRAHKACSRRAASPGGLSGVFQRLLRPGALLQTGLGAPACRKVWGKWI